MTTTLLDSATGGNRFMLSTSIVLYAGFTEIRQWGGGETGRSRFYVMGLFVTGLCWAQDTQYMFLQAGKLQLSDADTTVTDGTTLSGDSR